LVVDLLVACSRDLVWASCLGERGLGQESGLDL
jgi:hypothetical protein